jgi:hypothetical protein
MTREELERRTFATLLEELSPRAYKIALAKIAKRLADEAPPTVV